MKKHLMVFLSGCMIAAAAMGAGAPLLLDWGAVDTASGAQQRMSRSLRSSARAPSVQRKSARGTVPWLVQFADVVREEWKAAMETAGAELKGYVPENAFLVEATPEVIARIGALPEVSWVGEYLPSYKRSKPVRKMLAQGTEETREYNVLLFHPEDLTGIGREIAALSGAEVTHMEPMADRAMVRVRLSPSAVEAVTGWSEVEWVEPYLRPQLWNDVAVQSSRMNASNVWTALELTGAGQTIAVCDTGLDTGSTNTLLRDFTNRVTGFAWTNYAYSTTASWGDYHGHGTHVSGSVLGNGTMSTGRYKGVAYEANLIIQGTGGNLGGIPIDLNRLFRQAFTNGARIHSDSWGYNDYGTYSSDSRNLDMFVWSNKTMLILVAAGNSGTDAGAPNGVVDSGSVGSPGTAKNCLTVGASENHRTNGGYSANTWGAAWPSKFGTAPISTDYISQPDSPQGMAGFSGRGPCSDGRIKPDLVAPGTDIASTRSKRASNTGWGTVAGNTNYIYMGGTSMATPLTAGAAALARQWLTTTGGMADPSAALLKALMINGARNMAPGQYGTGAAQEIPDVRPSHVQGWGHVDLLNTLQPSTNQFLDLYDTNSLGTGQTNRFTLTADLNGTNKFILTLVYSDYWSAVGAGKKLVNDLDLTVHKPGGGVLYANGLTNLDDLNNVEMIEFAPDEVGDYEVRVTGRTVPMGDSQDYALVVRGPLPAPTPAAPVFDAIDAQSATVGVAKVFTVGATGYPAPALALAGTTASAGFSFTQGEGQLTYAAPLADVGLQTFTFTASNSEGVATQVVDVAVVKGPPAAPASIWASATNALDFTAAWDAVSGVSEYRLDVCAGDGFPGVGASFVSGYSNRIVYGTGVSVTGLTEGTTYSFRAYAVDEIGTSDPSPTATVTTMANQTIDFPPIGDKGTTDVVGLAATASSGLPVSFAVASGPAAISGGTNLTFTGTGMVSIAAAQAGGGFWYAAPGVTRTFNVLFLPSNPELSAAAVNVREAGEGRFYVRLDRAPTGNVAVAVGRSAGNTNLWVKNGAARTFTPANWSTWQVVTLAANADGDRLNETATFQVSAPGVADQFVAATALDIDIGENVALASGGSVIAGTQATKPEWLIDGVHDSSANYGYTTWTNLADPGTMTLDLRDTTTVRRIRLLNWDWGYRVHQYRIESSLDGTNWSALVDASAGEHRGWEDWAVDEASARYLRFTGLSNSANRYVCIAEWEVYGWRGPLPRPEVSSAAVNVREAGEGRFYVRLDRAPEDDVAVAVSRSAGNTNLFLQGGAALTFTPADWNAWQAVTLAASADGNGDDETATFRVSSPDVEDRFVEATALDIDIGANLALAGSAISGGADAANLIDGVHAASTNHGSVTWTSVPPEAMTLDLQELATVTRIRLLNWDWAFRAQRYRIESSVNGADWSILVDASAAGRSGWEDLEGSAAPVRYLRFTGLSNSADSAVSIAEWEVYGTRGTTPRPEVSKAAVNVREAGEGRFYVRLDRAPASDVAVAVARRAGSADLVVQAGAALTFTPANWSAWQLVTLAANADENADGETALFRVAAPGVADRFVEATALDDDIGENRALASFGSTISGTNAYSAERAIDGVHTSSVNYGYPVWTNVPPGTLTLDLKAATTVARIRLLNWDWGYRVHQYRIESSLDGAAWSNLVDASAGGHTGWEDWAVDNPLVRYLRFTALSNSANRYVCIAEWEVYAPFVEPRQIECSATNINVREAGEGRFFVRLESAPEGSISVGVSRIAGDTNLVVKNGASLAFNPTNWNAWQVVTLAANADANSDSETAMFRITMPGGADRFAEATALDHDMGTNWALASSGSTISGTKATKPEWLIDGVHTSSANYGYTVWTNLASPGTMTLDLQAETAVSRIRLLNWDWSFRTHQYRVESSLDGVAWSNLVDASTGAHVGWEDWAVGEAPARYLRFTGLSNSVNAFVCIAEWEVYGERTGAGQRLASKEISTLVAKATDGFVGSEPATVVTSDDVAPDYESGWAAVDGDPKTAWVGQKAGGGYVVVEYAPTLQMNSLEVDMAEGSLTGIQYLYSLDAQVWQPLPEDMEANPVSLNFLWLIFPDDGTAAVPEVFEIRPNP